MNGIGAIATRNRRARRGARWAGERLLPRAVPAITLFFADVTGFPGGARGWVEHALARVELTDAAARPVQEVSRGMS